MKRYRPGKITQIYYPYSQGCASEKIHPQRPEGIADRHRFVCIADQQEGTDACQFPEEIYPQEIVRKNKTIHRPQKNEQKRKEIVSPVAEFLVMMMISMHISHGIYYDERAYYTDDQTHQNGKMIHPDPGSFVYFDT